MTVVYRVMDATGDADRIESFNGAVRPAGQTRPGWKVLRVLGSLMGIPGFDFESVEQVRQRALAGAVEPVAAEPARPAAPVSSSRPGAGLRRGLVRKESTGIS